MKHWLGLRFNQNHKNIAIVDKTGSYTYHNLIEQVDLYSAILNKQIAKGSRIAILSDYSFNSIALLLAGIELNLILIPIISNNCSEIKEKISASGAQYLLSLTGAELTIKYSPIDEEADNSLCNSLKTKNQQLLKFIKLFDINKIIKD